MMLWIWLGVIIVTAIIELVTIDLVSIWFTLGGIGALIAYALGLNQTIQIIIFIILSVICIGISRPLAKKYLRTQTVSTNYDRVIGQHGLVLKRIDADTRGEVKVLSMEWSASSVDNSTLEEGDYLIINRMSYKFGEPKRGDIIVFESDLQQDDGTNKDLVKRVIGVSGDTIKIKDSKVYVNGKELNEPYIHDEITEGDIDTVVPENSVFVLGDNREISLDSRYEQVGFINESDILGKVFVRLYPFNKIGLLD